MATKAEVDDIVRRITNVLDNEASIGLDPDEAAPLRAIRRQIVNWPEHEDANSIPVLVGLAVERLRRIKEPDEQVQAS